MKVLVTAGNTMTMIDDVRAISNIFRGKTGNKIAEQMCEAGHNVILLTSSPDLVLHRSVPDISTEGSLAVVAYKTYDDLLAKMEYAVRNNRFDLIVHSAAVSDYKVVGTYVPCEPNESPYVGPMHFVIKMLEKIGKIIDKIRRDWGFKGYLVKFKLEVGITDGKLLDIARASRVQSNANLIVANCLEWASERAYVIGRDDVAHAVKREDIALAILRRMQ
jgi:phosphopantothenoylcysteine synthetase/decarboxylase